MFSSKGVQLIASERERHTTVEGWTPEHDKEHENGEMALAAASYAIPTAVREQPIFRWPGRSVMFPILWPWHQSWWKPSAPEQGIPGRIRELQKAGALVAAEIDRLYAVMEDEKGAKNGQSTG